MGQCERLYEKIKKNPKNVKFEEIDKLLVNHGGFIPRNGKGSHCIYKHPSLNDIEDYVNIPRAKPIKEIYIKRALRKFEKVMGLEN